jgi:hypothetical protein
MGDISFYMFLTDLSVDISAVFVKSSEDTQKDLQTILNKIYDVQEEIERMYEEDSKYSI